MLLRLSLVLLLAFCATAKAAEPPSQSDLALLEAIKVGDLDAAAAALHSGAKLETQYIADPPRGFLPPGATPLMMACTYGEVPIAVYLLDVGADATVKLGQAPFVGSGATSLDLAVGNKSSWGPHIAELAEDLINRGVDVNAQTSNGFAALHFAVLQRHSEVISTLIKLGAKRDLKDAQGETPADLAKKYCPDCLKLLQAGE